MKLDAGFEVRLNGFENDISPAPSGRVLSAGDGIVWADGLIGCGMGELVKVGEAFGIAMSLSAERVGIALLGNVNSVYEDMLVSCTGKVVSVPVDGLEGRVVDPLGRPLDDGGRLRSTKTRPAEADAPSILDRSGVNRPMETGLMAIDAMVPIGRGQRELIIGDRQTGKTSIAIDTILNQKGQNVRCFYVCIGQKVSTVKHAAQVLAEHGAMSYTTIICATASDPAPLQYLAPYSGCAMAEEVMYSGGDALIIYDDLTKHAVAYRTMSLLLHRPPGREAYPGDVFYLHSRLLERAAQLSPKNGGGSLTALPIIETMAGDISSYIPTNVISITDGQIFLDTDLFRSGIRPAINVGLSVSRVGGAAQRKDIRQVSGTLRLELAQYREMKVFSQFGSDLDISTISLLKYGERLTEALRQPRFMPKPHAVQAILLYAVSRGLLNGDVAQMQAFEEGFFDYIEVMYPKIQTSITDLHVIGADTEEMINEAAQNFLKDYEIKVRLKREDEEKRALLAQAEKAAQDADRIIMREAAEQGGKK